MVTRVALTTLEWIFVYFSTILYLVCCFTLTDINDSAPSYNWILYTSLVYSILYLQILFSNFQEIQLLRGQLFRLKLIPGIFQDLYHGVALKYQMFLILFLFFLVFIMIEIIGELLFVSNTPIQTLVLFFEISSWANVVGISYLFRPRKYSPFFFAIPVPTPNLSQRNNPQITPEADIIDNGMTLDNPNGRYSLILFFLLFLFLTSEYLKIYFYRHVSYRLPPLVVVKGTGQHHSLNAQEEEQYEDIRREDIELELAPLLPAHRRSAEAASIVVMNKADGSVSIGVHSQDLHDREDLN